MCVYVLCVFSHTHLSLHKKAPPDLSPHTKDLSEQDNLEGTFVGVDQQRDGALNRREFHQGLTESGIIVSEKDAAGIYESLPRGDDGLLDYHKFSTEMRQVVRKDGTLFTTPTAPPQ